MTDYIKLGMKDEGVKVTFYKVEGGEGERHILKIKGMKNFLQNRRVASNVLYEVEGLKLHFMCYIMYFLC